MVANASKHKDVNSVKQYYVPDQFAVSRATVACAVTSMRTTMQESQANCCSADPEGSMVQEPEGINHFGREYFETPKEPLNRAYLMNKMLELMKVDSSI
jgi:hypothetical protein